VTKTGVILQIDTFVRVQRLQTLQKKRRHRFSLLKLGSRIEAVMDKLYSRVRSLLSDRRTAALPDSTRYVMLKPATSLPRHQPSGSVLRAETSVWTIVEDELVLVAVKSNRWPRTIFRPKAVALMKRGAINELSVLSTLQDVPRIVQRRGPSMISVDRVTTVLE